MRVEASSTLSLAGRRALQHFTALEVQVPDSTMSLSASRPSGATHALKPVHGWREPIPKSPPPVRDDLTAMLPRIGENRLQALPRED